MVESRFAPMLSTSTLFINIVELHAIYFEMNLHNEITDGMALESTVNIPRKMIGRDMILLPSRHISLGGRTHCHERF
jgi:hypothetical protein